MTDLSIALGESVNSSRIELLDNKITEMSGDGSGSRLVTQQCIVLSGKIESSRGTLGTPELGVRIDSN